MIVLALDTTTRQGSIAVCRDGRPAGHLAGDATRTHAERLPGDIERLLERHDLEPADVDVFAVAAGPGSFTGLRVGIATIQGLAFGFGRPVVPVSALDALGQVAAGFDGVRVAAPLEKGSLAAAVMDGQRREVFTTLFRVSSPPLPGGMDAAPICARLEVVEEPRVGKPVAAFERWKQALGESAHRITVAGDGALAYRDEIQAILGPGVVIRQPLPPLAPVVACLAAERAARGETVGPHAIKPIYIRPPDAELARERQRAAVEGKGERGRRDGQQDEGRTKGKGE